MRWRFEKRSEVNYFDAFEQRPLFRAVGKIQRLLEFYPSVGITNQRCHVFLAKELEKGVMSHEDGEDIGDVRFFSPETIRQMLRSGQIKNSGAVIGLMAAIAEGVL